MLQMGGTANPLDHRKQEQVMHQQALSENERMSRSEAIAKLVAKYRDSTFMSNHFMKQKFIKIGESGMSLDEMEQNVWSVWNYGLCMLPNGGKENVMRASLHIQNTDIQIPFYANLDPLDSLYSVVNPATVRLGTARGLTATKSMLERKRKEMKLKERLKSGDNKQMKTVLTRHCPRLIQNLTKSGYLKHTVERETDLEAESSDTDSDMYEPQY